MDLASTRRGVDLSDEDVSAVLGEIRVHEIAVASVDAEMQELARQAAILRHKKHRLLELIAQCRGRITLALRVPDEILASIFEHCAATGWHRAPLTLSQVCRKWRQAAVTPRVFSRIHLSSDNRYPAAKTELWLVRAQSAPLVVTVDVGAVDREVTTAFAMIVDRSDQWIDFELNTRLVNHANDLLSACVFPMPNLISARILCVDITNVVEPPLVELSTLSTAFDRAPKLRHFEVVTNTFPPEYPVQVSQMSLELHPSITGLPPLPPDLATMPFLQFSNLPHLTSLTITTPFVYREAFDNTTPTIPLPSLELLTLDSYRDSIQILRYINSSRLCSLRVRSTESPLTYPHEQTGAALLQFISLSQPPLVNLELHDVDLPGIDYVTCFARLPTLQSLRLHETEIPDEVLCTLQGPDGLCPSLSRLDLRWCEQLAGSALVDLVASRLPNSQPEAEAEAEVHSETVSACSPITFVRVINCAVVKEHDILALARMTTCSVVVKEFDDYCRSKGCCNNVRYRQRLHLRHLGELAADAEEPLDLVLG